VVLLPGSARQRKHGGYDVYRVTLRGPIVPTLASTGSQYLERFHPSRMDQRIHRRSQGGHGHGGQSGSQWQPQHTSLDLDAVVHG
jgi:hypothetical protein